MISLIVNLKEIIDNSEMLTNEQLNISHHYSGHALVCAAPGSGKTTTMRHHILETLGREADVRILALMFNKDAQSEFNQKLKNDLKSLNSNFIPPTIRTFHAHAYTLLKQYIAKGLIIEYALIADEASSNSNSQIEGSASGFWRKAARDALASATGQSIWSIGQDEIDSFQSFMTLQKAKLQTPEMVLRRIIAAEFGGMEVAEQTKIMAKSYEIFENIRHRKQLWSFDDLIMDLVLASREIAAIRGDMASSFNVVIADEFQDVNAAQMEMLDLVSANARIMAVGDDDQSIYAFRGSSPSFMVHEFDKHFPGAKRYFLSYTFRFGPALANQAAEIIQHNKERIAKELKAGPGTPDTQISLSFNEDYGDVAAQLMREAIDAHQTCACLVRSYYQTALVEIGCVMAGVPYQIKGSKPFYARREALAILGWLFFGSDRVDVAEIRATYDGKISGIDPGAMFRAMLSLPGRYLDTNTLEDAAEAIRNGMPWRDWIGTAISFYGRSTDKAALRKADALTELLQDLNWVKIWRDRAPAYQVIVNLAKNLKLAENLERYLPKEQSEDRLRFIGALAQYAKMIALDVDGFVRHLAGLAMKQELSGSKITDDSITKPLITSYHRAKGLEYDVVILPDLQQGSIPYISPGATVDFEEERRLFFVAKTRAKLKLHMVCPRDDHLERIATGGGNVRLPGDTGNASQFLRDIRNWQNVKLLGLPGNPAKMTA